MEPRDKGSHRVGPVSCPEEAAQINSIAFSPDGRLLATASGPEVGDTGAGLRVWDVDLRKELWATNTVNPTTAVAFTKDSRALIRVVAGRADNLWSGKRPAVKHSLLFPHSTQLLSHSIALSPDGMTVATGAVDNRIILWDLATRQPKATLASPRG